MKLPNGAEFMHGEQPYDPLKAHEYYLKRRHLHPRLKTVEKPAAGERSKGGGTYTVKTGQGKTVKLNAHQLAVQKANAAHRVTQIKAKLSKLRDELQGRLAEARKREADSKKPKTAAEKHKEAQESKKFRDKHKTELKNKRKTADSKTSGGSKDKSKASSTKAPETVADLKTEIRQTRDNLKAAVATQRALSSATKSG